MQTHAVCTKLQNACWIRTNLTTEVIEWHSNYKLHIVAFQKQASGESKLIHCKFSKKKLITSFILYIYLIFIYWALKIEYWGFGGLVVRATVCLDIWSHVERVRQQLHAESREFSPGSPVSSHREVDRVG